MWRIYAAGTRFVIPISCLAAKGADQRIIDENVGHCTEKQRLRYRHLLPNKIKK